ncbi:DNA-binding response regulator, NarL/FixJ family, contains REC and HTH domains [Paenimyroides ummariense]|uniref:DNA-binding response regulator, NarL/FixJ family, contains REC and HTH domains n=1 Tax=Paenimyroides ummariense TaxID=913024 RepID=A0A1I4WZ92_9FLAO|nr:response regulator transcription factor [Paenimyroides ummariense]SFN18450.1 DNA-binding response regulator, NarL/FixJ family, contains REC and HTH domains [Paenimyroides ummariense]
MENKLKKFTIITADDHSVVTKSLSFIIQDLYTNATIHQINNLTDVVEKLQTTPVDLLILDVTFPDGNSLAVIPTIKKIQPNLKILIFSGHDEDIYAMRYLQAGVNGYLHKLSTEEEIKAAINDVITFGRFFSRNIQEKITNNYIFKKPQNPLEQLSNRELEISRLMVEGYGNIEICAALDLQKSTVSTYKNRIFEKLQIEHISELIHLFNLYKEV